MKIDSYTIGMDSVRTYSSSTTRKFNMALYEQDKDGELSPFGKSLSDSAGRADSVMNGRVRDFSGIGSLRTKEDVHQQFVLHLWQMLFGPEAANRLAEHRGWSIQSPDGNGGSTMNMGNGFSVITIQGFNEYTHREQETTSFRSEGTVTTSDGRSISFTYDLQMSRTFEEYYREEAQLNIANMCDPLVLNFQGDVSTLTDTKFLFDLDADGKDEEISTLGSGSGFLALDRNGDGIINNGSELFGTKSGNGFADLAAFDEDGNGWIDENDSIFDKLRIWTTDEEGTGELSALKSKNVGAIYLGNVNTDFTLRSATSGGINGAIRRTGIFLYEDGSGVGAVNHLDLAN